MNRKALLLALALACAFAAGGALAEPAGEDAAAVQVGL